jgi:hypothetical protein
MGEPCETNRAGNNEDFGEADMVNTFCGSPALTVFVNDKKINTPEGN